MNKTNSIFQLLVALFFGVALVYFLTYERMWDQPLTTDHVVIWLTVGLVLFVLSWGVSNLYVNKLHKSAQKVEMEKKELKAMIFDLERELKVGKPEVRRAERNVEGITPEEKDTSSIKPRENFK
ncbi:hypothetical protein [Lunatibacter salilacus]|uniref:hypothetical protein n=1 Tax=Lunatibacter salilacus TaxID=2483804 RepID=UPI00131B82BC|nr:hypothetical protein [Lunatibacter salilacus]